MVMSMRTAVARPIPIMRTSVSSVTENPRKTIVMMTPAVVMSADVRPTARGTAARAECPAARSSWTAESRKTL